MKQASFSYQGRSHYCLAAMLNLRPHKRTVAMIFLSAQLAIIIPSNLHRAPVFSKTRIKGETGFKKKEILEFPLFLVTKKKSDFTTE